MEEAPHSYTNTKYTFTRAGSPNTPSFTPAPPDLKPMALNTFSTLSLVSQVVESHPWHQSHLTEPLQCINWKVEQVQACNNVTRTWKE